MTSPHNLLPASVLSQRIDLPPIPAAMTATISLNEQVCKQGVQVTTAFLFLIVASLIAQGMTRVNHYAAAVRKKEKYQRAKDLTLLPIDRAVGNLLEWALPFLGFFWSSMILTNGYTLAVGWLYVAFRVLYPFVAVFGHGVGVEGARPPIRFVTLPAYMCLIIMGTTAAVKATV